jgi:uncharacterized protein YqhQ
MSEAKYQIGGQAVIEGVMMRSKNFWAVAVRKPDKSISTKLFKQESLSSKHKVLGFMFIRGMAVIVESMSLGFRALSYSVNEAAGEDIKFSKKEMFTSVAIAVLFSVGVFFVLPTLIGRAFSDYLPNIFLYNLAEGLIRVIFLLSYILIIAQLKDIKRVFQYHGAEHKTIHAYENGEKLEPDNVKKYTTLHERCGTSFLLIVMIVSIFVFAILGKQTILWRILSRVLLIPVITGISYEFLRLAGKYGHKKWVRIFFYPGLFLQKITTREPDNSQLEVAITSFKAVMEAEEDLKAD